MLELVVINEFENRKFSVRACVVIDEHENKKIMVW